MKRIPDFCEIFFPLKNRESACGPHPKTQARKGAKYFLRFNFNFFCGLAA